MSAPRRPLPAWAEIAVLPLINIALAFITVGIIVRIIGVDPFHALKLLVVGAIGSSESIGYTLYYATNFIFTGLAVAVAFHAGLFNIGGEGQAYIGGLGCGLAILALDRFLPAWLMIPLAIVAAALFGAAWAAVPAWLQAWRGSHIVITTIMFNFVASALMVYLMVNVLIAPGSMTPQSRTFAAGKLPSMHDVLLPSASRWRPRRSISRSCWRCSAASPSGCSCGTRRGAMRCAPWATIPRPRSMPAPTSSA